MGKLFEFGIEEEFFLTDLDSRDIVGTRPSGFHRECRAVFGDLVAHELLQSQVEIVTPILQSIGSARECLLSARHRLDAVAQGFGLGMLAAGTHPLAQWREQRVTESPRYERLMDDFQIVARRNLLCGLHVHVAVPAEIDRIAVMNRVMPWLPLLLALSASSPFWARKRTGLMSYRQAAYDEWPRTGIPDHFENERAYRAFVDFLVQTGSLKNDSYIWWAIRPSARFPTLELRIADACPRVEDALCVAAIFRALVRHAVRTPEEAPMRNEMTRLLIEENRWRAKRFGTRASFLDQGSRRNVSIQVWLDGLQRMLAETGWTAEDDEAFAHARGLLDEGGSAQRQLDIYVAAREAGLPRRPALARVVDDLLACTRGSAQPAVASPAALERHSNAGTMG